MSPDKVSRIIEQELNTTIEDLFESIDLKNPLGAASIAQVQGPHAQHVGLAAADFWPCASVCSKFVLGSQAHRLHSHRALHHVVNCCCSLPGHADACMQAQSALLGGCILESKGCHACRSTLQVHKGKLRSSGIEVAVKVQYEDALEVSSLLDRTPRAAWLMLAACWQDVHLTAHRMHADTFCYFVVLLSAVCTSKKHKYA